MLPHPREVGAAARSTCRVRGNAKRGLSSSKSWHHCTHAESLTQVLASCLRSSASLLGMLTHDHALPPPRTCTHAGTLGPHCHPMKLSALPH